MQDAVSIVHMCNAFKKVKNWGNHGHMSGEEKLIVGYKCCETARDKEKQMNHHQQDCSVDEFIQDNSQSSVQNCSMLEEKIANAINISNLYIGASEKVALLIVFLYSYCDVCL